MASDPHLAADLRRAAGLRRLASIPLCALVMDIPISFVISPMGYVHSSLKKRSDAPRQGWEDAPNARLEIDPAFIQGLDGIKVGEDIWIFTWLHGAQRS